MNRFLKFLLSLSTVAMTTILPIAANDGHEAVAGVECYSFYRYALVYRCHPVNTPPLVGKEYACGGRHLVSRFYRSFCFCLRFQRSLVPSP